MTWCYVMNVHADTYETTIMTIYGSTRSDATCNGDLRLSTENE